MATTRKPSSEGATCAEGDEARGILGRWSERKLRARNSSRSGHEDPIAARPPKPSEGADLHPEPEPTDADMPPLESLDEHSDFSGFLSPKVSEELRRLALRKLFSLPKYNVSDGLDDYSDDFKGFAGLGSTLTHEMRRELERERERLAKKLEGVDEQPLAGPAVESSPDVAGEGPAQSAEVARTEVDDPSAEPSNGPSDG